MKGYPFVIIITSSVLRKTTKKTLTTQSGHASYSFPFVSNPYKTFS